MRIIGITGGTGAGKSSAARRFETHAIPIVDADKIGHDLIAPGGDAVSDVITAFGEEILEYGKIHRGRLGAHVFANADALATLNAIMQPRIAQKIGQRCADHAAAGHRVCLIDAALLADNGTLEPWLEALILVSSSEEQRVGRLTSHREMDPEAAWERVRAQVNPESKRSLASWVIENNGDITELHQQVDAIAHELTAYGGSTSHD